MNHVPEATLPWVPANQKIAKPNSTSNQWEVLVVSFYKAPVDIITRIMLLLVQLPIQHTCLRIDH